MTSGEYSWLIDAIKEVFSIIVLSISPIAVAVLILMLSESYDFDFVKALMYSVKNGEAVVYCATLMAPILYRVVADPPIKFRALLSLIGIIILLIGLAVYALQYFDAISSKIFLLSSIVFGCSVVLFAFYVCLDKHPEGVESAPSIMRDQTISVVSDYAKHRENAK